MNKAEPSLFHKCNPSYSCWLANRFSNINNIKNANNQSTTLNSQGLCNPNDELSSSRKRLGAIIGKQMTISNLDQVKTYT